MGWKMDEAFGDEYWEEEGRTTDSTGCCGGPTGASTCSCTSAAADTGREPTEVGRTFEALASLMRPVLADGGRKRAAGTKAHWTVDPGHEAAMRRHLVAYNAGHLVDPDSGAHPLVHVAVRALMIAGQEKGMSE